MIHHRIEATIHGTIVVHVHLLHFYSFLDIFIGIVEVLGGLGGKSFRNARHVGRSHVVVLAQVDGVRHGEHAAWRVLLGDQRRHLRVRGFLGNRSQGVLEEEGHEVFGFAGDGCEFGEVDVVDEFVAA